VDAKVVAAPVVGGAFLITATTPQDVFTPEDFSEEHRLIAQTARDVAEREIRPHHKRLEGKDWALTRELIHKLGELGFLGIGVPTTYGGSELDMITSLVAAEELAIGSFSVSYGAHVGIGMEPIVFFGTPAQRAKYLPPMVRGDLIGAYALTEPTAGSDAMAIRATATRTPDGRHFVLAGAKQFISNAAFADLFNVFAKVDGDKHTCFIVERTTEGVTVGEEEHKMGIRGSSTASVFLEQAKVPAENVLGEIGQGFKVAVNILNMGRFRLATACVGAGKQALRLAIGYAQERHQFGRALGEFGLIKAKLAEMAIRLYAAESMAYRTGGLVEGALHGVHGDPAAAMRALEEYAIECAINKVFASEVLDYVADEMVQVYGGYGFIEDYPAAGAYRDSRINRLFEGTNEINRLLTAGMLLRRAQRGRLALIPAAQQVVRELTSPAATDPGPGVLADEQMAVTMAKKAVLFAAGVAAQKYLDSIDEQQEVLAGIADLVIETFAMESLLLRARRAVDREGAGPAALKVAMAQVYISDALPRIEAAARTVLAAVDEGDSLRTQLAGLRRFLRYTPKNTVALRRMIAGHLLQHGRYVC
jgi:alkylation response protein AidB-like acyl-CoA dehydrogenase